MNVCFSDFRQRMKLYMDKLCSGNEVIKVTRQRGGDVFVISEEYLASMSTKEFKELQREARLKSYYEKFNDMKDS